MARRGKTQGPSSNRAIRKPAGRPSILPRDMAERDIAKMAIRDSETRYRRLFETAQDGILLLDAETGQITDVNPFLISMLGYSHKEFLGKKLWEVGAFKDIIASKAKFLELQKKGYVRYENLPLQAKSGKPMAVEFVSNTYRVDHTNVIQCNIRDITDRKRAEDRVKLAEARYSDVFNNSMNCIAVYRAANGGEDFTIVDFNKAAERVENVRKKAILGKRLTRVFPGVKAFGILEVFRRVWKTGKAEYFPAKAYKDNRIAGWRENYILRLDSGEIVAIYSDLTNEKQAEQALQESELKFRRLVESSNDLVMLTGLDGKVTYLSPACRKVLGWEPKKLLGTRPGIFHPDDKARVDSALAGALKGKGGEGLHYRVITPEGRVKWVSHSWSPIMLGGKLQMIASVVHDITERKAAQEQLTDIIESLPDATFAIDLKGRVIYWNKEMESLSGVKSEKMLGKAGSDVGRHFYGWKRPVEAELLLKPDKEVEKRYAAFNRQGDILTAKGWVPRLMRGKPGYMWVMVRPLYDPDGAIVGAIESVRDITEQKRNEDALQRNNRMLALISECNQAIVRSSGEKELMREICRALVETGGYRMAWAGCVEKTGMKRVIPEASYGFEEGYLKKLDITWADTGRGRGPTGTAVRTGRPAIARDIHNDRRFAPWRKDALARGYSSSISIPLKLEGERCGALNIYSERPDAFDAEELRLLGEVSLDIAHGISGLRAKNALAESEKTFAAIFNNSTDIVVFLESSGRILKINPSVRRMWGHRPEDIIGKRISELSSILPPESIALMQENFRKRLSGEDTKPYVVEARTASGRQVLVEVRGSAFRNSEGIAGAVVTLSDITERMLAEKRLLASYRVESVLSAGGPVAEAWPVILRTICTNLGWDWGEIWVADEAKKRLILADKWHQPSKKYLPFENVSSRMQFKCGSGLPGRVWVSGKPVWVRDISKERVFLRTSAARVVGFKSACALPLSMGEEVVGVMVFFSEKQRSPEPELLQSLNLLGYQIGQFIKRKSAEDSLRYSEARFRNVFEHGPVGILLSEPDFHFIRANPSACRIFGYSESELCQRSFRDITHPEHLKRDIEKINLLGAGKIPYYRTEKKYVRKDGAVIWGLVNVSAIWDADGRLQYYLAMVEDITEQKRNEDLLRSQKDQLEELSKVKERFMADMTHELKTPLSVILLNLNLAHNLDKDKQRREFEQCFDLMWRNAMRLSRSIEQIMRLTNMDSVEVRSERFSLDHIMRSVFNDYAPLARSKGVDLQVEGSEIRLDGDPHLLAMAVSNLVSNAIKFTEKGRVLVTWAEDAYDARITVTDTGIGISRESQPKIFSPFFKENYNVPGSGIGLLITRSLIERMGGIIGFQSKKGLGSTFTITIPKEARK